SARSNAPSTPKACWLRPAIATSVSRGTLPSKWRWRSANIFSVGRQRVLAFFLDAAIVSAAVDLPALAVISAAFLFFPDVPLTTVAWATFGLSLAILLCRDARGGFSRKWFGLQVEDRKGHPPGVGRSVLRNLPLLVPGWNAYEGWRAVRGMGRSIDAALGLA